MLSAMTRLRRWSIGVFVVGTVTAAASTIAGMFADQPGMKQVALLAGIGGFAVAIATFVVAVLHEKARRQSAEQAIRDYFISQMKTEQERSS
jgi:hypothetical protein